MQDRPDARELVQTVATFIEKEIVPTLSDARLRFRGLIAANVLAIVARELAAGDGSLRNEWQRLNALVGDSASESPCSERELRDQVHAMTRVLSQQIRAGEAEDEARYGEVLKHVEATVIEKLQIANPRYLERVLK